MRVHPTMIHTWKKQLVENAEEVFQNWHTALRGVERRKFP